MRHKLIIILLVLWYVSAHTQTLRIISDSSWRGRNTFPGVGWLSPGYSDASWLHTTAPNPENVIPVVPGSLSMWQRPNRDTAYMRKTFTIPVGDSYSGTMVINSDNAFYVFFNGVFAGLGTDWFAGPFTFTITPSLTGCSENVIAIIVVNYGGPFGCSLVSDINVVNPLNTPVALASPLIDCNGFMSIWNRVPTATGYYLDVSTDTLFGSFLPGYNNRSIGSDTSLYIGGLTTGVTYYYRVRCTRGLLTSCNSNVIRVTTASRLSVSRNLSLCSNDSIFLQGAWRDTSGVYVDSIRLLSGCDSVVITNLTVHPTHYLSIDRYICDNDSSFINGVWRHLDGVYTERNRSIYSCDSIIDFNLTTRPTHFTRAVDICNGELFFVGGSWQNTSGIYTDYLSGYLGCDSILVTTLTVENISQNTILRSICYGQSYLVGGALQNTSGSYYDTLVNHLACDSILRTNLTVLPYSSFSRNVSICSGGSFFAGGMSRSVAGVYFDTLVNAVSCDSILQTTLNVLPISTSAINYTICSGDSILCGGLQRKTTGIYYDTLVNVVGCDSVLQTNLLVIAPIETRINREMCAQDSLFIAGAYRFLAGIYYDTLVSINSCDSILRTNLVVNLPVSFSRNIGICDGVSFFAGGRLQNTSGIYYDTLMNIKGCDSTLRTNLSVFSLSDTSLGLMSICEGDLLYGNIYTKDTFFLYHLYNVNGCDSIHLDLLSFHRNPIVNAGDDQTILLGESSMLMASGAQRYLWSNGETTYAIKVTPNISTSYVLVGEDSNACINEDTVHVNVIEPSIKLLIPTAFSPNSDGVNDVFRILNYYDFNLATFSVYDRWGQVVYDGSDNSMIGWDGNYKGRAQPIGVYTYYISGVSKRFNKSLSESGNFTLMR